MIDIPLSEYLTGDRFRYLCDVDCEKDPEFERKLANDDQVQTVFCQTHELTKNMEIIRRYKSKKFIMVTQNSDGTLAQNPPVRPFDYLWHQEQNVYYWYSQNLNVVAPNVYPIPIGFENQNIFKEGAAKIKHEVMDKYIKMNVPKENKLFLCFNLGTNTMERETAWTYFLNKPFALCQEGHNNMNLVDTYFNSMSKCRFVLCPEGNGLDCIRLWEALYLGCIPVIKPRPFVDWFSWHLPMIIVRSWDEVSLDLLNDGYKHIQEKDASGKYNWEMLKMSYWKDEITRRKAEIKAKL